MRIFINNRSGSTNGCRKNGYGKPAWYSVFDPIRRGLSGSDWPEAWRKHDLQSSYDIVVVGGELGFGRGCLCAHEGQPGTFSVGSLAICSAFPAARQLRHPSR